jgi:hypothetical protein
MKTDEDAVAGRSMVQAPVAPTFLTSIQISPGLAS